MYLFILGLPPNSRLIVSRPEEAWSTKNVLFKFVFFFFLNKYDLTFCQAHLHTASETFVCHKKIGSGKIFCIFASVASILI